MAEQSTLSLLKMAFEKPMNGMVTVQSVLVGPVQAET